MEIEMDNELALDIGNDLDVIDTTKLSMSGLFGDKIWLKRYGTHGTQVDKHEGFFITLYNSSYFTLYSTII